MTIFISSLAIALVAALCLVLVNRRRFAARVAGEMRALLALPPSDQPQPYPSELPAPVRRYRDLAVGDRAPVHSLRMHHGGTFRLSPTAKELPIRGDQLFTGDPPGYVWTGHIHMGPGIWIDARDMAAAGKGSMRVLIDDTIVIADAHGPQLDQGAGLRLLAEMPWYPTALFDARYVTWSAIDADHAEATLRFGSTNVTGVFAFGPDGLPSAISGRRFNDQGQLLPWGGIYRDFRSVSSMRVPFEVEVTWELKSGPYTYAHWRIDSFELD